MTADPGLSIRHVNFDAAGLEGDLVGYGVKQLAGAVHVGQDLFDTAEQQLNLAALGLDLVKQATVVRLRRLQAGVELALLGRQVRCQVGGQDIVCREEMQPVVCVPWHATGLALAP